MAGVDSELVSLLQLPPTLLLLVAVFLLADIELSDVVPGANDNASGVATVLAAHGRTRGGAAENLDVWVVLPGAEECLQEGMRSFVRAHRKRLASTPTYFINLDTVGDGDVRFNPPGGWAVGYRGGPAPGRALRRDRRGRRRGRRPLRREAALHGARRRRDAARISHFASISIACTDADGYAPSYHLPGDVPDAIDPDALDRAHGFTLELVRQLDRDVGRRERARREDRRARRSERR